MNLDIIASALEIAVSGLKAVAITIPETSTRASVEAQIASLEDLMHRIDHEPFDDASSATIAFVLETEEPLTFLRLWNEGEFETLRREWPEAPDAVYIGADTLFVPNSRKGAEPYAPG